MGGRRGEDENVIDIVRGMSKKWLRTFVCQSAAGQSLRCCGSVFILTGACYLHTHKRDEKCIEEL